MSQEQVSLKVLSATGQEVMIPVVRLIEVDGVPFDHTKLQMNAMTGEDIAQAFNLIDGRLIELERVYELVQTMFESAIEKIAPKPIDELLGRTES